ncbi:probable ATP-dependent DNA helicase HFM1 [Aplysia californica]|uniref:DNA 3'-5' helicase n=1 Tax=Aplysia californica TaxID=6500 RepID=A0ABM1A3X6_APLCA|nr:probable ATP-dependent DNA helicase HFM1 [Aplysia californica]
MVMDQVLYSDKSVVVSAPTGSGKTVAFELAIVRLLLKTDGAGQQDKIVYMSPMKSLCGERFQDWSTKFTCHGLNCLELTGDTELDDLSELFASNLICTTPEKWDSMSRRWKDNKMLFQQIKLFLIDEVHILNDPNRGATVEAVVSRMKTLQTSCHSATSNHIRFVAVSATMPNYNDITDWLSTPSRPAVSFNLEEKYRPVKLERVVMGYPFKEGTSEFRFDMNLSYRLRAIIDNYCHGKPTLVDERFEDLDIPELNVLSSGIGMHHAGLDTQDRHTVEELFKSSRLPVLISTSTLAMGVNLPAHLVIIKSTFFYNMGVVHEYSDMQLLQMIGRAGRPQFDTSATAVIMTKMSLKVLVKAYRWYWDFLSFLVSLHKNLIEHLNAEVVLQTITNISLAVEWMRHTFLYVRVMKNAKHYGLPAALDKADIETRLQELCLRNLNLLTELSLVHVQADTSEIMSLETGKLMARYCIAFETMRHFHGVQENQEGVADLLEVISGCAEFCEIQLRTNEKKILNSLNHDKNKETIRFPLTGKIKTKQMKVNCLIQAQLSCLTVQDFSLSQDMTKIFRVGQRVTKCFMELMYQGKNYSLLLHSLLIYKAFKTKLWFDSRYVSRQLDGIGQTMSLALANSGLSSFQKLEQASPRDIEVIVNRHPPFGNHVKAAVEMLPKYELAVEQVQPYKEKKAVLKVCVELVNAEVLQEKPSGQTSHQAILLVGDEANNIVYKCRIL